MKTHTSNILGAIVLAFMILAQAASALASSAPQINLNAGTGGVGAKKVLVITVEQVAGTGAAMTSSQAREEYFTGATSANAYFSQQSNGLATLTGVDQSDGDVVGPVSVPQVAACDVYSIADSADAAALVSGTNPDEYDNVVYALPGVPACGFAGVAQYRGRLSWLNFGIAQQRTSMHELGHNFGVDHSGTIRCTDGATNVALSDTCTTTDYGDPFTAMGATANLMSSYHRFELGQLPSPWLQIANDSTDFALASSNDFVSPGPRLLMIPRKIAGEKLTQWFAIERRSTLAPFDLFAPLDPVVTGFTVRLIDRSTAPMPKPTRLIDTTPSTNSFTDSPLLVGHSFTDPTTGLEVAAIEDDGAKLRLTLPTLVDDYPPNAPTWFSWNPQASSVALSWRAAVDDFSIDHYEVIRNDAVIYSGDELSFVDNDPPVGSNIYKIAAIDVGGNTAYSTTRTLNVSPPAIPDPTPDPPPETGPTPPTSAPPAPPSTPVQSPIPAPALAKPTISIRKKATKSKGRWTLKITIRASHSVWTTVKINGKLIEETPDELFVIKVKLPKGRKSAKMVVRAENSSGSATKRVVLKR